MPCGTEGVNRMKVEGYFQKPEGSKVLILMREKVRKRKPCVTDSYVLSKTYFSFFLLKKVSLSFPSSPLFYKSSCFPFIRLTITENTFKNTRLESSILLLKKEAHFSL